VSDGEWIGGFIKIIDDSLIDCSVFVAEFWGVLIVISNN